jgi:hypothetical protein
MQRDPMDYGAGDMNLYEYVNGRPTYEVDEYGDDQTAVVGVLHRKDSLSWDGVDRAIEKSSDFDVKAYRIKDFYIGLRDFHEKCVKKEMARKWKEYRESTRAEKQLGPFAAEQNAKRRAAERTEAEKGCCISKLIIEGHNSSALGGGDWISAGAMFGEAGLTGAERTDLAGLFCSGGTVTLQSRQCSGASASHIGDLAGVIIGQANVRIEGYEGGTYGIYPAEIVPEVAGRRPVARTFSKGSKIPVLGGVPGEEVERLTGKD